MLSGEPRSLRDFRRPRHGTLQDCRPGCPPSQQPSQTPCTAVRLPARVRNCYRLWRGTLTSCLSLWTLLHAQPPKIASTFLERSAGLRSTPMLPTSGTISPTCEYGPGLPPILDYMSETIRSPSLLGASSDAKLLCRSFTALNPYTPAALFLCSSTFWFPVPP
jgi:hypothetical protein